MVLLIAGYVVVEYRLDKIKRANAKIREEWTEINLANQAQLKLDESIKVLAEYVLSGDPQDEVLFRSELRAGLDAIEQLEHLQEAEKGRIREEAEHTEQELNWIHSFKQDFARIESTANEFLSLPDPKADATGTQTFNELRRLSNKVIDGLAQFRKVAHDQLNKSIQTARHEENVSERVMFISVLGMVCLGVALSLAFSKSIAAPIIRLRDRSREIGLGKFGYVPLVSHIDEIKDLDAALQRMAANLKDVYENQERVVQEKTTELRSANDHLQKLFNGITDGIAVIDRDFNVIDANCGLQELSGLSRDEIVATRCYTSHACRDLACERCPAMKTFETGKAASVEMIWKKNGQKLHVEIRTFPLSQNGSSPSMVIEYVKDVSAKRKMEEQLFQSSKLAAIGTLSAGIAHEINNPLTSIVCGAEAVLNRLECGGRTDCGARPEVDGYLRTVQKEVYHCKRITQSLLDFSRQSETGRELFDMNQVISSTLELLNFRIKKKRAAVHVDFGERETYLVGDGARLKQVCFNILNNALDAIRVHGNIWVTVRKQGDAVICEITDDGQGINPESRERVFEPFYTTKPPGEGTGLGLAICYGIIQEHGGDITINSRGPGQGTTVTLKLPS